MVSRITPCILGICLAMLFLESCAPVYVPNAAHTPLMTQRGEAHAGAFFGSNGLDGQISYAISNRLIVGASASFLDRFKDSGNFTHREYGDVAVGYYTRHPMLGRVEFFVGAGTGTVAIAQPGANFSNSYKGSWLARFQGSFNRGFLQATVGVPWRSLIEQIHMKEAELGATLRVSYLDFYQVDTSSRPATYLNNIFFEPSFFMRSGWANLKLEFQAGISFPLNQKIAYDWQFINCSVGFQMIFGKKYDSLSSEPPPVASQ